MPEVFIQSRAGFYQIKGNGIVPDMVLSRANGAFTKTNAKHKIHYFDPEEEKAEAAQAQIESDFMQAMQKGDVVAFYQPKVNIETGKIVGVEALCRWVKEDEVITPFVFIPVLERNNQICTLDFYMLNKVCLDLKSWLSRGNKAVRVSVNFSRNNLADKNFVNKVIETIDEYRIPHDLITVEFTETSLEADFEEIGNVVQQFRGKGVQTAVDDFGMGYSSLSLIKDITWDVLKIDKGFVPNTKTPNYRKQLVMFSSVVHLANDLGMLCVAEGVETQEQLDTAKMCGCKVIQGFYYDKPLCKEEFEQKMLGTFKGECKWKA